MTRHQRRKTEKKRVKMAEKCAKATKSAVNKNASHSIVKTLLSTAQNDSRYRASASEKFGQA